MRALALALAVTVAAAPACTVRHRVTVSGADLRATIAERHRLGRSQLTGKHWRDDRVVGRQRVVVVDGQALWLDGGRLSLRELEQGALRRRRRSSRSARWRSSPTPSSRCGATTRARCSRPTRS